MHGVLLAFKPPESWWCRQLGRRFPALAMQVVNAVPASAGRCIETVRLHGASVEAALAWLRSRPGPQVLVMERRDADALVRVIEEDSPIGALLAEAAVVPWFPFTFDGRECQWLLLGDSGEAVGVYDWLAEHGIAARTLRAGHWQSAESDMTPRQAAVMESAVEWGYYDFPRRITLTELAQRLAISKSTLSGTLMAVEHKVMAERKNAPIGLSPPRPQRRPDAATG